MTEHIRNRKHTLFHTFLNVSVSSAFNNGMCVLFWLGWRSHDPLQTCTKNLLKECGWEEWPKKMNEKKKRRSFYTDISLAMPQCLSYMLQTQDLWASLLNKGYSPKATEAKPGWWGVRECTLWPLKSELAWLCCSCVEWTWVEERDEQGKDIWVIGLCFLWRFWEKAEVFRDDIKKKQIRVEERIWEIVRCCHAWLGLRLNFWSGGWRKQGSVVWGNGE